MLKTLFLNGRLILLDRGLDYSGLRVPNLISKLQYALSTLSQIRNIQNKNLRTLSTTSWCVVGAATRLQAVGVGEIYRWLVGFLL